MLIDEFETNTADRRSLSFKAVQVKIQLNGQYIIVLSYYVLFFQLLELSIEYSYIKDGNIETVKNTRRSRL
jgi:hypothetical protein